jgi:hypothetical protein
VHEVHHVPVDLGAELAQPVQSELKRVVAKFRQSSSRSRSHLRALPAPSLTPGRDRPECRPIGSTGPAAPVGEDEALLGDPHAAETFDALHHRRRALNTPVHQRGRPPSRATREERHRTDQEPGGGEMVLAN